MEHYAGIDVSLEESSVCIVDATGTIVREVKIASEPEALIRYSTNWNCLSAALGSRPVPCRNGCMPGLWPPDAL
jgi:hypothetical protein